MQTISSRNVSRPSRGRRQDVARVLRQRIVAGLYGPGDCLPRGTDLAAESRTSHVTVLRAVEQLRQEGFLHTKRGEGTFVTAHPPHLYECTLVLPDDSLSAEPFESRYFEILGREALAWNAKPGPWRMRPCRIPDFSGHHPEYQALVERIANGGSAGLLLPLGLEPFAGTPLMEHPGLARATTYPFQMAQQEVSVVSLDSMAFLERALTAIGREGRHRVAVLLPKRMMPDLSLMDQHRQVFDAIARHGLATQAHWIIQISPREAEAVRRIVQLLLEPARKNRPDALIFMDDHITEPATRGVLEAAGPTPKALTVVTYCNFPDRPTALVPVRWLGFDCHKLFTRLVTAIDTQRRTGQTTYEMLQPVFEEELEIKANL